MTMSHPEIPNRPRRALVLRHHLEDDAGLIGEGLAKRGFTVVTVLVDAQHRPPLDCDADVVVILGSNSSVHDLAIRDAWFDHERRFLQQLDAAGTPMLGICFGAQALCDLFGGRVERAEHEEIGWFEVTVAPGVALSEGPWFEYHEDRCLLPDGAEVWASTDRAVQAFAFGPHVGVQFHPEIDAPQLARWFDSMHGSARAYSPDETEMLAETERQTDAARGRALALVDQFLSHAASRSS